MDHHVVDGVAPLDDALVDVVHLLVLLVLVHELVVLELLDELVKGGSYTSIAKDLFLSPHTVKTHIKNIYKKLHIHTRAEAVRARLGKL